MVLSLVFLRLLILNTETILIFLLFFLEVIVVLIFFVFHVSIPSSLNLSFDHVFWFIIILLFVDNFVCIMIIQVNVKVIKLYSSNRHYFITVNTSFLLNFILGLFCCCIHVLQIPSIQIHQSVQKYHSRSIIVICPESIICENKNHHAHYEQD